MISALLHTGPSEWIDRVRAVLASRATVLDADARNLAASLPTTVAVDLVFMEVAHLTEAVQGVFSRLRALHPEAVVVCLAEERIAQRAGAEGSLSPDFWVVLPASDLQLRTYVDAIMAGQAGLSGEAGRNGHLRPPVESAGVVVAAGKHGSLAESVLCRVTGRMMASVDADQLLSAFCDAVHELAQCVSYCLLWREPEDDEFRLVRALGLSPVVEQVCRVSLDDPLPRRLQKSRGIVTSDGLNGAADTPAVARQLEMCGGVLAVPLFFRGTLRGTMILGPKAIGSPYTEAEAETLFILSSSAASAVRQIELHTELAARNSYIDQVLSTMESGVVTIDAHEGLCVCNPYAARVLRLGPDSVRGGDLRELPSPLGDHLFASLRYDEQRTREEVRVFGGETVLRFSTRRLVDPQGEDLGSMLLLEDITAEHALAEERRKVERGEVISQVMARFAHELKNPLATINTFAELLPTNIDDPEFREFWSEHVRRDVHRLDDLVAKLVSLTTPPGPSGASVHLPDLLQRAVDRVALLDEAAQDHIAGELNGNLPPVRVAPEVMATALSHLLRFCLGTKVNKVRVQAEANGRGPVTLFIRAPVAQTAADDPQQLLDPTYVLDHPDIDLGPSASQRLIEGQGGTLAAYIDEEDMVFRVVLQPAVEHSDTNVSKE